MKWARRLAIAFALIYLLPAAVSLALWAGVERPGSWREADWRSSGVLPEAKAGGEAAVHVLAARVGGLKSALAVHSWIVFKRRDEASYTRYEVVGWGTPLRRNAYAADGFWYSNRPEIVASLRGEAAERAIPRIEAAIAAYPYARAGQYRIWPGPNSNSFVAHVLRQTPELEAALPPIAVGKDWPADGRLFSVDPDGRDFQATLFGLAGVSAGMRSGLELNLLGLVAGLDFARPAIKLPGFGRIGF